MFHIQTSIFYDFHHFIKISSIHQKYFLLFSSLDLSATPDRKIDFGRKGHSQHAMLRAFIIKHLEQIKSVPELIRFLDSQPVLTAMCGFEAGNLPDESQFYRFLQQTNNSLLQTIHQAINQKLINNNVLSMNEFIADSKPVMAPTRENNFKNPNRNTRNKLNKPKRNPSATLSYYSYQEVNGKKDNFIFFWGYRTHVLISKEGIPLVEITLPNNQTDAKVVKKLLKKLKRVYGLKKGFFFLADAAYDERELYNFIVDELKGKAFIPLNKRNTQENKTFGPHGSPLCEAGLEMKSDSTWTEGLRTRIKFRCPLKKDSTMAAKYPNGCPIQKPCFSEEKAYGCTKYLDVTDDARAKVPRDSESFKSVFNRRTGIERYFARLGDREFEQTTHYKMRTIKNQMTVAHLTMSLVAYAAAILMKQPEKIRCYRTLADEGTPLALAG